jgi:hypothetical protein
MPDRLYVAVNANRSNRTRGVRPFLASHVLVSDDAGKSWTDLGFGGETEIVDLKLGIDRQNLYASTVNGVWVLPLSPGA